MYSAKKDYCQKVGLEVVRIVNLEPCFVRDIFIARGVFQGELQMQILSRKILERTTIEGDSPVCEKGLHSLMIS